MATTIDTPTNSAKSSELRLDAENEIATKRREVRYDTRDFPVEMIVSKFEEDFFIPGYQREYVWSDEQASRFIESVILGLPIPMMFLAEDEDGRFEIVDGVQRISSLKRFRIGDLRLEKLMDLPSINGFVFDDLPEINKKRFNSTPLRIVVLDPGTTEHNRRQLFERINRSGSPLNPSERRNGAYDGPFMSFLQELSHEPTFRGVCPISAAMDKRKEGLELATRFFAYSERYEQFEHDVDKFLDNYVLEKKDSFDRKEMTERFLAVMRFVERWFPPKGFAKTPKATTTPRVRFEAIAVGVHLALKANPSLTPSDIEGWLESDEFRLITTTHASNSGPRLRRRIEFVRDHLLGNQ